MSDLISRSALIEALQKEEKECEDCMIMPSWYSALSVIGEQPPVEARPVVHGEWLDNGKRDSLGVLKPFTISCSVCGSYAGTSWMNFCPNCGADMRKKVEDGKID